MNIVPFIRIASMAALLAASAGCGKMNDLKPAEGQALPVKPLMARATPDAEQLLTPPANANPDRIDELMKRSAPRRSDRFDLPPPSGNAPAAAVETLDQNGSSNEVGPVTPQ